jgi:hypothetical protein
MKLKEILEVIDFNEIVEITITDKVGNPVLVQKGYAKDFLEDREEIEISPSPSILDRDIDLVTLDEISWQNRSVEHAQTEQVPCLCVLLK